MGGPGIQEEQLQECLLPCGPTVWSSLARPEDCACGPYGHTIPGGHKESSPICVAELSEGLDLEEKATEVKGPKFGWGATKGEEGIHKVGVAAPQELG